MYRDISDGDLDRALSLLPEPLFRNADIYDVAVDLGFRRWYGATIWYRLIKNGRIVRTATPICRSGRWCYWERTEGSPQ